ncbi:MAG: dUTP diphosphatase, partial [Campylobacterales bacterium]|nr:dUTP diphosphatase [Campylobacterales bacterium]
DIWHFVMSLLLEDYKTNGKGNLEKLVHDILDVQGFEAFTKEPLSPASADPMELINDIESIIHDMTGFEVDFFDGLLKEYFALSRKCGINLKVLYKFYVAKNVLNQFRQDHGYKEGHYKKVWNGKEDNEVMLSFLSGENAPTIEALYKKLEGAYAKA